MLGFMPYLIDYSHFSLISRRLSCFFLLLPLEFHFSLQFSLKVSTFSSLCMHESDHKMAAMKASNPMSELLQAAWKGQGQSRCSSKEKFEGSQKGGDPLL